MFKPFNVNFKFNKTKSALVALNNAFANSANQETVSMTELYMAVDAEFDLDMKADRVLSQSVQLFEKAQAFRAWAKANGYKRTSFENKGHGCEVGAIDVKVGRAHVEFDLDYGVYMAGGKGYEELMCAFYGVDVEGLKAIYNKAFAAARAKQG